MAGGIMAGKVIKITPEVEAKVIALYLDDKYTNRKIAEIIGISSPSVTNIARKNNLPPKIVGYNFSESDKQKMAQMYKQGTSIAKVCQAFGIKHHKTLCDILDEQKVKRRPYTKKNKPNEIMDNFVRGEQRDQLCWYCKNATGRCSWTNKTFTPVQGWDAKKVVKGYVDTYDIRDCPLFEKG
jgi:transposase-like protein